MPELPEIETIKRGLGSKINGLKIKDIEIREEKLFKGETKEAVGQKIEDIKRRAKMLIFSLSNDKAIIIHLKMTGQLIYQSGKDGHIELGGHPERSYEHPLPHKHTHIIFTFNDGSKLYFNDLRKFGYIKINAKCKMQKSKLMINLGPEPFDKKLTSAYLMEKAKNRKITIYQFLMDQSVVAGIGNIYVSEILYDAGIFPLCQVCDIEKSEWKKIISAIRLVLKQGIDSGGSTINTFRDIGGKKGNYLEKWGRVYGKRKCPAGHEIQKKKIGGRTSHYCEKCQRQKFADNC